MATTKSTTAAKGADTQNFTAEEREAMKDRANEARAARKRTGDEDPEPEVLAKIATFNDEDRALAEKVHAIVKASAPDFAPRLWYGMPAYGRGGKATVFFKPAGKFKQRYCELGFNGDAALDDGGMWPTVYALTTPTAADEQRIAELVKRAAG